MEGGKTSLRRTPASERDAVVDSVEEQLGLRLADQPECYPYTGVLTWDGVRTLKRLGFGIGSHTATHPNLALLPADEILNEFDFSRRRIEDELEVPCRHVCYPYGGCTPEVCKLAAVSGYQSAMTTRSPRWNKTGADLHVLDHFAMPREAASLPFRLAGLAGAWIRQRLHFYLLLGAMIALK